MPVSRRTIAVPSHAAVRRRDSRAGWTGVGRLGVVGLVGMSAAVASAGDEDGVLLKASDLVVTQGTVADIQIRATTVGLVGGFGFNVNPGDLEVSTVRYDGPIFKTSWQGWDSAPSMDVRVDAVCVFTEDQVEAGDHNLVTLEALVPADIPAGTVLPITMTNIQFFNYDFSIPSLDPQNGSITVVRSSDLSDNGVVGPEDIGLMIAAWGPANSKTPADLDANGMVDGRDLGRLIDRWGTGG